MSAFWLICVNFLDKDPFVINHLFAPNLEWPLGKCTHPPLLVYVSSVMVIFIWGFIRHIPARSEPLNCRTYLMNVIDIHERAYIQCVYIMGTLGYMSDDIETLGIGVTKFTTARTWGAFSCHLSCVSMSMTADQSIPAFIKHHKLQMHKLFSHVWWNMYLFISKLENISLFVSREWTKLICYDVVARLWCHTLL